MLGRTLTVAGTGRAEGGGGGGGGVEKKINMAMKRRPTGKNGGWFREVEPSYEGFDAVFQRDIVSGLVRLASLLLLLVTGKCVGLTVVEELVCVPCILLPHCRFERRGRALSFVGTSIRTELYHQFCWIIGDFGNAVGFAFVILGIYNHHSCNFISLGGNLV